MSKDTLDQLVPLLKEYVGHVENMVVQRNSGSIPIDLYNGHIPSVFAGLLSRQATLTTRLAQSPTLWDGHIGPLILRSMVECLVTFKWIAVDADNRAAEYVSYGLGQAKLMLSHLQREISEADERSKERLVMAAKMQEAWILSQRLMQFVDVGLGSWSGSSIRKLCEEVDEMDLYQFWFVPYSSCVHSTWQHVSIWNTRVCKNPLHLEHRVSAVANPDLTLEYVEQSAKLFDRLTDTFDSYYDVKVDAKAAYQFLMDGVEQL